MESVYPTDLRRKDSHNLQSEIQKGTTLPKFYTKGNIEEYLRPTLKQLTL